MYYDKEKLARGPGSETPRKQAAESIMASADFQTAVARTGIIDLGSINLDNATDVERILKAADQITDLEELSADLRQFLQRSAKNDLDVTLTPEQLKVVDDMLAERMKRNPEEVVALREKITKHWELQADIAEEEQELAAYGITHDHIEKIAEGLKREPWEKITHKIGRLILRRKHLKEKRQNSRKVDEDREPIRVLYRDTINKIRDAREKHRALSHYVHHGGGKPLHTGGPKRLDEFKSVEELQEARKAIVKNRDELLRSLPEVIAIAKLAWQEFEKKSGVQAPNPEQSFSFAQNIQSRFSQASDRKKTGEAEVDYLQGADTAQFQSKLNEMLKKTLTRELKQTAESFSPSGIMGKFNTELEGFLTEKESLGSLNPQETKKFILNCLEYVVLPTVRDQPERAEVVKFVISRYGQLNERRGVDPADFRDLYDIVVQIPIKEAEIPKSDYDLHKKGIELGLANGSDELMLFEKLVNKRASESSLKKAEVLLTEPKTDEIRMALLQQQFGVDQNGGLHNSKMIQACLERLAEAIEASGGNTASDKIFVQVIKDLWRLKPDAETYRSWAEIINKSDYLRDLENDFDLFDELRAEMEGRPAPRSAPASDVAPAPEAPAEALAEPEPVNARMGGGPDDIDLAPPEFVTPTPEPPASAPEAEAEPETGTSLDSVIIPFSGPSSEPRPEKEYVPDTLLGRAFPHQWQRDIAQAALDRDFPANLENPDDVDRLGILCKIRSNIFERRGGGILARVYRDHKLLPLREDIEAFYSALDETSYNDYDRWRQVLEEKLLDKVIENSTYKTSKEAKDDIRNIVGAIFRIAPPDLMNQLPKDFWTGGREEYLPEAFKK